MNGKINHLSLICSVKKLTYSSGKAKGLEVYLVNNGVLQFEVLVDKGLDLGQLYHKGTNVSCSSANGLCSFNGEFDDVFNVGMLYTCGLDTFGGRAMPIHGKFHNIPAEITTCKCDENGVIIVGEIYQTSLFGDKLKVERTIKTKINSNEVEISDKIINLGYTDAKYCVLYHTNIGYPMLDEGVKIIAPIIETVPRNDYCKKYQDSCLQIEDAENGKEEYVYFHKVEKGEVKVVNEKLNKQVIVSYDNQKLPYFIEWKSMMSGAYALGIEPATATLDDEFELKNISPNESVEMGIKIKIEEI